MGTPCAANERPGISGLPSLDYAVYLFDTFRSHLGQRSRSFDEGLPVKPLHESYHGDPARMAIDYRLSTLVQQFLLVVSFGTAFRCRAKRLEPPGSAFFVRAMSSFVPAL